MYDLRASAIDKQKCADVVCIRSRKFTFGSVSLVRFLLASQHYEHVIHKANNPWTSVVWRARAFELDDVHDDKYGPLNTIGR